MLSYRGPSRPRDQTCIAYVCLLHWQAGSLPLAPPGKPIMQIILLQIFFGEIFQIPFGERHLRHYSNPALTSFDCNNSSTKILSFSIHFDSLLKKLLKIGSIYDATFYRVGVVKGKTSEPASFFFCPLPQAFSQEPWQQLRQKATMNFLTRVMVKTYPF